MRWDFASVFANTDALPAGAVGTLRIFAICLVLGLSLGLLVGLGRYARSRSAYVPATMFVDFFRNTPVLVQILWSLLRTADPAAVLDQPAGGGVPGISLNSAAFSAEIYRGGIQSIDRGQWDGARAIGTDWAQAMRRIILPQALKPHDAASTNRRDRDLQHVDVASAVADVEPLQQGKLIASNFNPIEAYTAVAAHPLRPPLGRWRNSPTCSSGACGRTNDPAQGRRASPSASVQRTRPRHRPRRRPGRAHRDPGRFGLGQEHLAAPPQLHGDAGRRHRDVDGWVIGRRENEPR